MEFDGEHRAGAGPTLRWLRCETGATWLDLVATVSKAYGPTPIERLDSTERFGDWLATQNLLPEVDPAEADLVLARGLREALRGLALATARSESWSAENTEFLNKVLAADQPLELTVGVSTRLEVRRPATSSTALARIARQAAEQLTGPVAANLRTCADAECGMLFLDPGGRRRWCAAEICGVRNRVRAHRQRRILGT